MCKGVYFAVSGINETFEQIRKYMSTLYIRKRRKISDDNSQQFQRL